ncbi:HNH endonuclease [Cellulomonas sp. Marseille-Q8402]
MVRRRTTSAAATTARARYARRRRRRVALADNDLTPQEWDALVAAWAGCAYCRAEAVPLQRDCVLPISRGGRYTLANVVPACASCNASKHNDEVTGWLRRKRLGSWSGRRRSCARCYRPTPTSPDPPRERV